jgi:hypothetical protein
MFPRDNPSSGCPAKASKLTSTLPEGSQNDRRAVQAQVPGREWRSTRSSRLRALHETLLRHPHFAALGVLACRSAEERSLKVARLRHGKVKRSVISQTVDNFDSVLYICAKQQIAMTPSSLILYQHSTTERCTCKPTDVKLQYRHLSAFGVYVIL